MIIINKLATKQNFIRKPLFYQNARAGWEAIIKHYMAKDSKVKILLPSYIGYSVNEGSGIFDPITSQGCLYGFYKMDKNLSIDFDDLKACIQSNNNCVVLLVHYFGFPDIRYNEIWKWLKANNISFVEDCAHAMFSDYIGGSCGRKGDFSFYSLHKLLPLKEGGMVVSNGAEEISNIDNKSYSIANYDLRAIYDKRRMNYSKLSSLLKEVKGIIPLHKNLPEGVCPQTFPILVKTNRDNIYFEMNKNGYGFVSLYHTLISNISKDVFPDSHYLANHITNIPLHQDANFNHYKDMVILLKKYL